MRRPRLQFRAHDYQQWTNSGGSTRTRATPTGQEPINEDEDERRTAALAASGQKPVAGKAVQPPAESVIRVGSRSVQVVRVQRKGAANRQARKAEMAGFTSGDRD